MADSPLRKHTIYLWLTLILLVVTWLGTRGINADILFVDEYWSIRNSGGDPFGPLGLMGIWERTATVDPGGMGVLYHWLLNAWGRLIGWSIFSIRAFSLMAGLLAVAMVYQLGAALFNRRVGLYAVAMLGFSAFFIDYLHEARAYTLLAFFVSFTIYAYQKLMLASHSPSLTLWGGNAKRSDARVGRPPIFWYIALALSLAALAYTHYVALALGIVLGIFHLTQFKLNRRWWLVVVAMAIGGLLFLPWLGVTLGVIETGAGDANRQSTSMNAVQILQNLPDAFSNANLALLGLLGLLAFRQRTKAALLVWIWLIVAVMMVLIINAMIPFMVHLRYLMIVWPAFALLVGLGIWHMRKMGFPSWLVVLVWIVAGMYQSLNGAFIDNLFGQIYRAPASGFNRGYDILQERAQEGDIALFHIIPPDFEPFNLFVLGYYFNPFDDPNPPLHYDQLGRMNESIATNENEYLRAVWDALDDAPAAWLLEIPELETPPRRHIVEFGLQTAYEHCETVFAQDDMVMQLLAKRPDAEPDGIFAHDENAVIEVYDLQRGYQDETTLHMTLGFEAEDVPTNTYSVGLHLVNSDGELVAQRDTGLPEERHFGCFGASLDIGNLPAGNYRLQIVIYNRQTGERLFAGDDDSLVLDTIALP